LIHSNYSSNTSSVVQILKFVHQNLGFHHCISNWGSTNPNTLSLILAISSSTTIAYEEDESTSYPFMLMNKCDAPRHDPNNTSLLLEKDNHLSIINTHTRVSLLSLRISLNL
ncbi:hypothetical protein, partial [Geminicoccus harenae]|uniref:hypothetical protein n=1 Tax=Geminicoccus harenae TaxID=2498453 RepID=UPI001C9854CC